MRNKCHGLSISTATSHSADDKDAIMPNSAINTPVHTLQLCEGLIHIDIRSLYVDHSCNERFIKMSLRLYLLLY